MLRFKRRFLFASMSVLRCADVGGEAMIGVEQGRMLLENAGCFEFLRSEAREVADEVRRQVDGIDDLYAQSAWEDFEVAYQKRMGTLYINALLMKVRDAVKRYDALEYLSLKGLNEDALARAASDVAHDLGDDVHEALAVGHPLINEYHGAMRRNFVQAEVEMVRRLLDSRDLVSSTIFDGVQVGRVLGISSGEGDSHRHGRAVRRIQTEAGAMYYKPHDCKIDVAYGSIVDSWFEDCVVVPKLVCGDDFGFFSELVPRDVEDESQIPLYFYRMGMLLALFHALGTVDMHAENLLAIGPFPAPVDMETLFRCDSGESDKDFTWTVSQSVMRVAMLPFWVHTAGVMSPLYKGVVPARSLPCFDGVQYDVRGFERNFAQGFEVGYERVLRHRDGLLDVISSMPNTTMRLVLRNTIYYIYLRMKLFRYNAMTGEDAQQKVLDNLRVPYAKDTSEKVDRLVSYEARCLVEGDIPYYCVAADGNDLCGANLDEVLQEGYVKQSALEGARVRVRALSREDLVFEGRLIEASFDHAPTTLTEAQSVDIQADGMELCEEPADVDAVVQLCSTLLDAAWNDRITMPDGRVYWLLTSLDVRGIGQIGLATGQADVLSYCCGILEQPVLSGLHEQARRIADVCIRNIEEMSSEMLSADSRAAWNWISLNVQTGLGAVVLSCARAARVGIPDGKRVLADFVRAITGIELFADEKHPGDEAGLLLALIAACDARREDGEWFRLLETAVNGCAKTLLGREPSYVPCEEAQRGLALAHAARLTGETEYATASAGIFERLLGSYRRQDRGWPESTKPGPTMGLRLGHAGQIGLYAEAAIGTHVDELARQVLDCALESVCRDLAIGREDTLANGNAGTVLFLVRAARRLNRPGLLTDAGRMLAAMMRRCGSSKCFLCSQPDIRPYFEVSVPYGSLGVGLAASSYGQAAEEAACRGITS